MQGYELFKQLAPELDPDRLWAERILALYLYNTGKINEAAQQIAVTLQRSQQVFGANSTRTNPILQFHLRLSLVREDYAEAERSVKLLEKICVDAQNECNLASTQIRFGEVLWRAHKISEAEAKITKAVASMISANSITERVTKLAGEYFLAELHLARNEPQKALNLLGNINTQLKELKGSDFLVGRAENALGYALWLSGNSTEASQHLENGVRLLSTHTPDIYYLNLAKMRLRHFQAATGRSDLL
jgi:tetratricopeptide (TPR) repeat protein